MSAPDIFLSYNREDADVARCFADGLERQGFSVWWDQTLRSGQAYDEVTENALKTARAVVVLWSPRSVVSRWVRAEATLADRAKTLIPAMIEPCERPIMFELTQTADLSHWSGDAGDKAWLAFLDDVRRFVGQETKPEPAPQPAKTPVQTTRERGGAPSLAVLPFANRSGLPEDDVFAFGMVEDLIDALSQSTRVRVLASSATARFRNGTLLDVEAMGRELGVRYLLEGNVRRSGEDLRVTAQLIEAASGSILWTQRFSRPLNELAALQEELIEELAAHLDTQFFRLEMEQALKKPGDLTAWECTMRALAALRQISGETVATAIEESTRAVSIAPDYGLAHALLALSSSCAYLFFSPDDPDEVRRIRHHVDRALACDNENAGILAHVACALAYSGQAPEAILRARRAIEISPSFGYAHFSAGIVTTILGLPDAAFSHFSNLRKFEPDSPYQHYAFAWEGLAHIQKGDLAAAGVAYGRALALGPDDIFVILEDGVIKKMLGRSSEAKQLALRARHREPATTLAQWELRLRRWMPEGSALEGMLASLRTLWSETEGAA